MKKFYDVKLIVNNLEDNPNRWMVDVYVGEQASKEETYVWSQVYQDRVAAQAAFDVLSSFIMQLGEPQ